MKEWFKKIWEYKDNKKGFISAFFTMFCVLFIFIMFGVNILKPSVSCGATWLLTIGSSFLMFMGINGRWQ